MQEAWVWCLRSYVLRGAVKKKKDTVCEQRPFLDLMFEQIHNLDLFGLGTVIKWANRCLTPAALTTVIAFYCFELFLIWDKCGGSEDGRLHLCSQTWLWSMGWSTRIHFFSFLFWLCRMWDLSSPTRDWARAPGSESAKSWPLDRQRIPLFFLELPCLWIIYLLYYMQLKFNLRLTFNCFLLDCNHFWEVVRQRESFSNVNLSKTIVKNICRHPVSSYPQPGCLLFE